MTAQKIGAGKPTLVTLFSLFLVACDGGTGDSLTTGIDDNESPPLEETPIRLITSVSGDAVPGQTVKLSVDPDTESAATIRWEQTGGPAVNVESSDAMSVHFRVPPISRSTAFSFVVIVTGEDGISHRRPVRVLVKAMSWKDLEVVETELTENFVVFRANKDNSLRTDLYRADLDGANIVRLNGSLVPGGNVHAFAISPDGENVAYLADEDTQGVMELFRVDAAGGPSTRISGDLAAGGNVTADFLWSPDSTRIAYRANQNSNEVFELFAAHNSGTPPVRLSGDMTVNGDVVEANFFWSSDSRRIAYRANQFNDNTLELFVSSRNGAQNLRVSSPPVVGGGVLGNFAWMPAGRQIAYVADLRSVGAFELFVVNDDGSGNSRVSGPLVTDGSVLDFAWAPDAGRIAYRAEQLVNEVVELYSVLPDGNDNTLISALPVTGDVGAYEWAPDGSAVAYLADQVSDETVELFAAGPDGTANRRVSGPLTSEGDVIDFSWSPDSRYLAYRADQVTDDVAELFTSTPNGAVNVKVSGTPAVGGNVRSDWRWSGESSWLAYRADQRIDEVQELFTAAPDGSANVLVSGSMTAGGNVESLEGRAFEWSPDSTRIVYSADQQENDKFELYVTAPDSGIAIASISGILTSGGDVLNFALASRPGGIGLELTGIPDPATVFNSPLDCYSYANNLVNSIWHRPSDLIIGGHFANDGFYSHAAGDSGYSDLPDNDTATRYARMVHTPGTATVIRAGENQFPSPADTVFVGTIDPLTGALSNFAAADWSDGFSGFCNLISSSATEFMCYDGARIRHYETRSGSADLMFVKSVPISSPPANVCDEFCFGGTFAWDGVYYYIADAGDSSSNLAYNVYDSNGSFVTTHTADGAGAINGLYFDWSAGAYATHDGFGNRMGTNNFVPASGIAGNDTQCYTLSPTHVLP